MTYLQKYLAELKKDSPAAASSVENTVKALVPLHIESFNHKEHVKGLLLGQVQSGKTGQMLGITAAAADVDDGFRVFVLLTSDITALQQQTYKRALASLATSNFNVCDEHDEIRFCEVGKTQPSLIVLKKNSKILKKWRDILSSSGFLNGRPIFIIDDEADAASLNTQVNKKEQSAINNHLQHIVHLATSSFYLQVTATPQSLFLQTEESEWRPSFVHYFEPGKNYLGGEFFYSKPKPFTNVKTDDDELDTLLKTEDIAEGLKLAIETYLVTASQMVGFDGSKVCNFLVHPSVRISDHEKIKLKVEKCLTEIFTDLEKPNIQKRLEDSHSNLKKSKPNLISLKQALDFLRKKPEITVYTMNSGPLGGSKLTFDRGLNIVIGGNSLGRGVTFKGLQTVYYCRSSKTPQVDTFWQHCRMFGYDREPSLMRVFMPDALYKMFAEINASNEVLVDQIKTGGFEEIQIVTDKKVKPTRKSVIDQSRYDYIMGGVNYFPPKPDQDVNSSLDKELQVYDDQKKVHDISLRDAINILQNFEDDLANGWSVSAFISAIKALQSHKESPDIAKLVVRRDRDISKDTGTLLSPNDRKLGDEFRSIPVITMYRLKGDNSKGWDGKPFWVPNIKMPEGKVFHKVS